jgi:hypothetical protein
MATTEDLDASPLTIMAAMRGTIARASIAYPEVLHLDIHDREGRLWRFSTQDADYDPADPGELDGRSVEDVSLAHSGELRIGLSGAGSLTVTPTPVEADDDPPNWEVITPDGLVLEFGPGLRWEIHQDGELPHRY